MVGVNLPAEPKKVYKCMNIKYFFLNCIIHLDLPLNFNKNDLYLELFEKETTPKFMSPVGAPVFNFDWI